jgi:hypothetical protein
LKDTCAEEILDAGNSREPVHHSRGNQDLAASDMALAELDFKEPIDESSCSRRLGVQ